MGAVLAQVKESPTDYEEWKKQRIVDEERNLLETEEAAWAAARNGKEQIIKYLLERRNPARFGRNAQGPTEDEEKEIDAATKRLRDVKQE